MSDGLKLTYFNLRGLGEPIRLLLHDNKIPFVDDRVEKENWPSIKPKMPFGQLPCLYDKGKEVCQSGAIMRHLGRRFNLYGSADEMTYVDEMYEGVVDLRQKFYRMIYTAYDTKDEFLSKVLPEELGKFEKFLKGKKFFLGDKMSIVDYAFFELLEALLALQSNSLDHFPLIKSYHASFACRPNFKAYRESKEHKDGRFTGSDKL